MRKWLQSAIQNPGALHRKLGVPEGEPIPADKMQEAAHSNDPHVRRMANLAKTMSRFHHAKKHHAAE